jgi:low affinity Fe/Cu permease
MGWITNPRKAAYNRIYNRTTFGLGRGCLVMVVLVTILLVWAVIP